MSLFPIEFRGHTVNSLAGFVAALRVKDPKFAKTLMSLHEGWKKPMSARGWYHQRNPKTGPKSGLSFKWLGNHQICASWCYGYWEGKELRKPAELILELLRTMCAKDQEFARFFAQAKTFEMTRLFRQAGLHPVDANDLAFKISYLRSEKSRRGKARA